MRIIRSVRAMAAWSRAQQQRGLRVGLVPTMGALHEGHCALIRRARRDCDAVVVSLFVNPLQFGPREDYAHYPRRRKTDARLCEREGVDVLFCPTRPGMYPPGFQTSVQVWDLTRRWEGAFRRHHFAGVATVVTKLLSLVRPQLAYFGQKDFQQTVLVKHLSDDLSLGARIVVCPTVRARDGLALSSRNAYLAPAQRKAAPVLYAALRAGQTAIERGERLASHIRHVMLRRLDLEPQARLDYVSVCDPRTLQPVTRVRGRVVLLGAIRIGGVRLIDNVVVRGPRLG